MSMPIIWAVFPACSSAFRPAMSLEPGDLSDDPRYARVSRRALAPGNPWHPARRGRPVRAGHRSVYRAASRYDLGGVGEDLNEDSIVLLVDYGISARFSPGDAGAGPSGAGGRLGPVDLLKVGHHGAGAAPASAWLARVAPRAAVISVGSNDYGHPSPAALGRLRAHGVPIWRTDRMATVTLRRYTDGASRR